MSKLLSATLIATITLSASELPTQKDIIKFVKRSIIRNPRVKINKIDIVESRVDKRIPDWTVLFTTMNISFQGKDVNAPLVLFANDHLMTTELYDYKTKTEYSKELKPTLSKDIYNDAHLLMGHKDAKHKIVVFSDPQCPFCQDVMPDIFKAVQEHPDTFALYYYHLPLKRLHPVSETLTKVMHVAQNEGKIDMVTKMYQLKINIRETNEDKILKEIEKQFGYKLTKEQINTKEVKDALKADEDKAARMMISGTPTVYLDGEWDKLRDGYEKYITK
jgi:protein-disulfide isomerase